MVIVAAVASSACGTGSANSPADRLAFEKRVGADETKARSFVSALKSVPFMERDAYLKSHPTDVRNLALIRDPALQQQFRSLLVSR
jgi:hypothetical protein